MRIKSIILSLFILFLVNSASFAQATDGSQLWFTNQQLSPKVKTAIPTTVCIQEESATFKIIKEELAKSFPALGVGDVSFTKKSTKNIVLIGTADSKAIASMVSEDEFAKLGDDGFLIRRKQGDGTILIAANTEFGALYGVYEFLRLLKTSATDLVEIDRVEIPSYQRRILNHWDNLDGTVERGYAGYSIWKWDELPGTISPRYEAYARANASIGINGTVLNNVNANPDILTKDYLEKVKVLAGIFRPYGIRVYLSVNFSSPKELGGLENSDPLNDQVKSWWNDKADEIYAMIPDFGGFLVKANSEGLPGPQDYGRTHADGANMLADALAPHGGIVMWRAFVYNPDGDDRAKQAYKEFVPLDGQFRKNVIIQLKNGPIDFQPREPFSPMFGAMKHTTLMPEFQITQEYLGFSDHLVFLSTLFEECLDTDTYAEGPNTTIARITDGEVYNDSITAIAGVANIGEDTNWCGHHFAQSNWYAFGRLAWNNKLSSAEIANEWLEQTFTQDADFVAQMKRVMLQSREAVVNYMTPIGLHHLMGWSHHYGPEPWCEVPGARPDWLPTYYHKADSMGIGFDRSTTGSEAVLQYAEPLRSIYDNVSTCPEMYLLWFHHLSWDYVLHNGNTLWDELCYKYSSGVDRVKVFQKIWDRMEGKVDAQRFKEVQAKLAIQATEAIWWRDACLLYFQTFSGKPIPEELDRPVHVLEKLKMLKFDMTHHN
ncbi:alpha-glucuronidase family glycosyl hydrolase [Mangrovibacterium marinum]|uniref:Xylan alpha-1,2-glucuronidase n=1 Tax=Mangrovibacterium marinum TaxID=1639118 RepID=A0A2T5C6W2_9BACT|nr:alpha-glucuronidase family glycosyl hydrolase [Mangrovibacterium marinum]PTN10666.1 alpha-glucuronidase [Mangrovibacterium marinum]